MVTIFFTTAHYRSYAECKWRERWRETTTYIKILWNEKLSEKVQNFTQNISVLLEEQRKNTEKLETRADSTHTRKKYNREGILTYSWKMIISNIVSTTGIYN